MTSIFVASSRRGALTLAGAGLAVMLSASSAAFAGCSGTGALAIPGPQGVTPFLPFASGGAVASLVSAINTANTAFLTQSTAFVSAPPNPAPNQEGGGVWARAIGGEITTKNTTVTSNVQALGVPVPGTITCDNENKLTFAGAQVGTDMATLNVNEWNIHIGSTVGYLGAKSRDTSSAGPLNPQGGTFQDTLQVPFVGFYGVATKGRFFMDAMVRGDFYQNNLNDPLISGIFNQKLDARGLAFSGNVGYNFALQNNWFIEPSAGIVVSKVKVDPLNVTGTGLAAVIGGGAVGTFPGQLLISDINSTLGRLSLRGGTTIASGNMIWQPFVTLSVYREFQGAISSSFDGLAATLAESCDGKGACPALRTVKCDPYACGVSDCLKSCAKDADCAGTSFCSGQACVPKNPNGGPCNGPNQCTSGVCADGVCCDSACTGAMLRVSDSTKLGSFTVGSKNTFSADRLCTALN